MNKRKVLIADSSEDFRCALADTLHGIYHIRTTADGNQAMQLLRSFLPDILIVDLMLPGLDGITLLQHSAESGIRPMVLAFFRRGLLTVALSACGAALAAELVLMYLF